MRDLEIRGAGNILGTQQSGHIATVGYELYCQLLENAVRELQEAAAEAIGRSQHRPAGRGLSAARLRARHAAEDRPLPPAGAADQRDDELDDFAAELRRSLRPAAGSRRALLELARLRIWAHGWGVREIRLEDRYAVLGYASRDKLARLVKRSNGRLRVADAQSAYLPLASGLEDAAAIFAEVKALLQPTGQAA